MPQIEKVWYSRRSRRRRSKIILIYLQIILLLLLAIFLGAIVGAFYSVSKVLPSGHDIEEYRPTEVTRIISSDGVVLAEVYEENREVVPITDIPKDLQNATVAIEDVRFYKHWGVDLRGMLRAFVENVRAGRMVQGGSTLTQQLARNLYLTREKRLSRKLQEIILALRIERNYSKEQILELYLNEVYYGSGAYGVQTASKIYFGKDVKDLTLAECALLAGLPKKPSVYSPYENLRAATGRRNVVLDKMAELGYITREQCEQAKKEPVRLVGLKPGGLAKYKAPWFVTYVLKQLTRELGADMIYKGGLEVHTTLNYEMQQAAEEELRKGVAAAKYMNVTQGALICLDPHNGHIKAMVGGVGKDFTKDQFNRAVQARRQPGSSFKVFVYTAAIDNGYDPSYRISNSRVTYAGYGSKPWTPKNANGRYGGTYDLRQALAQSINVIAVKLADKVGIDQVITYARILGIKSKLERTLSLALGTSVVTPLEMVSAYSVFANGGVRAEPMAVTKITDGEGGIIKEYSPITNQVLSRQTAETMSELLRGVVLHGTGRAARGIPDAHGKTGTTSDCRDAWFIGYTPELACAVWVGNDDFSPMRRAYVANVCAPTWTAFMRRALEIYKREKHPEEARSGSDFEKRDRRDSERRRSSERLVGEDRQKMVDVTICTESGCLATKDCPSTYRVSAEAGTEPKVYCPIHSSQEASQPSQEPQNAVPAVSPPPPPTAPSPDSNARYLNVTICVDSGRIANEYCPETITRRYRVEEAPTKVCTIHRPPRD